MELNVFMKNVLLSKAKAMDFACFRLIDGIEIAERLKKLEQMLTPEMTVSWLEPTRREFNQKMAVEGCVMKGHLITRDWARTVGTIEEFDIMNKVCSKLVHPTAWSILTEEVGPARFSEARNLFFVFGAKYFLEIFVLLKEHISQHGVKHKPDA